MKIEKHAREIDFTQHRNDLFCDVGRCKCSNPLFKGSNVEYLIKKKVKLTGYNDDNFFNNVNKDFKQYECNDCGAFFEYRWTPDFVIVKNCNDKMEIEE
jgi:hypothetical protein